MTIQTILNPLEEMAYPTEFSMDTLKSLSSYAKRLAYVKSMIPQLASGSSRVVFKVDDEKVLKVAKNQKGIAQNESELDWGKRSYNIVAKIFDFDDDYRFLEMEFAKKATPNQFKALVGYSLKEIEDYLYNRGYDYDPRKYGRYASKKTIDPQVEEAMHEDEWVQELVDLCINYGYQMPGDFGRISSYGIVNRGTYGDEIVLTDYGLSEDVYDTHYRRK